MRYDTYQFGSFDDAANRKTLWRLLDRLGHGLNDLRAGRVRARFLGNLLGQSQTGFAGHRPQLSPMSTAEAYQVFIALTGVLGVPLPVAIRKLEGAIRQGLLSTVQIGQ